MREGVSPCANRRQAAAAAAAAQAPVEYPQRRVFDSFFPLMTASADPLSSSYLCPHVLIAFHNRVQGGDGQSAAAAPAFKDDLRHLAAGKQFF